MLQPTSPLRKTIHIIRSLELLIKNKADSVWTISKTDAKFHPDKVHHLGEEFQKMAEEKFKSLNEAYGQIKKERNMN